MTPDFGGWIELSSNENIWQIFQIVIANVRRVMFVQTMEVFMEDLTHYFNIGKLNSSLPMCVAYVLWYAVWY